MENRGRDEPAGGMMRKAIRILSVLLILGAIGYITFFVKGEYENSRLYDSLKTQPVKAAARPDREEFRYDLAHLKELNPDCVGIVEIPGTIIYYPVVFSAKEDGLYYLRRDFYGKRQSRGSIFMDYRCDPAKPSTNLILYGHRMRSGQMFARLMDYKSKDFWKEHRIVRWTDDSGTWEYEIFAVYLAADPSVLDEAARHYQLNFIDGESESDVLAFGQAVKTWSYYDTSIAVKETDQFLTLKTCDYAVENGRMVVVARRCEGN